VRKSSNPAGLSRLIEANDASAGRSDVVKVAVDYRTKAPRRRWPHRRCGNRWGLAALTPLRRISAPRWMTALGPVADVTFSVINSMLPPQFQDMLYVRCLRDCKTGSLQTADTELSTIN